MSRPFSSHKAHDYSQEACDFSTKAVVSSSRTIIDVEVDLYLHLPHTSHFEEKADIAGNIQAVYINTIFSHHNINAVDFYWNEGESRG